MRSKFNGVILLLVASLAAVIFGVYRTNPQDAPAPPRTGRRSTDLVAVDQSSLITVEKLVRMTITPPERSLAADALRLADQDMDLAFAQAVRSTANQTRQIPPEARALETQLQKAQRTLEADQAQVKELTAAVAKATPSTVQSLTDRLNLAQAQTALDQDEVDDVTQDLRRAGGDLQGRIQEMIQEHEAASQSSDSLRINVTPVPTTHGLVNHVRALQDLYQKESQLKQAGLAADSTATAFKARHDRMEARAAARRDSAVALSHDSSAALLALTQRLAQNEKARSTLDQRMELQHKLSDVYTRWIGVVRAQEGAVINRALKSIAAILVVVLIALLLARWIEYVVSSRSTIDRRRTQTLYMVTRVSLQVLSVLVILLIMFGPPENLGTFLGLAGAGLTVALKDFIIGFIGWFVLMGKNGIRIGDLVEINGVTGEVVELGMFYTVLLETGDWSDSGHPTGRRVTFMNGFAIEGHYFNFSTSGRWLWDEVHIAVPAGIDPYPIVESMRKQIDEATAESARQAAAEWKEARRAPHMDAIAVAPSINLKPISGGVEIVARYITHVAEREELKAKLYHTAIEMLGGKASAPRIGGAVAAKN
ncbi:MAG TPA: mechanosensitive ion channel domain-containing protein [Gemmatimonadaceae bacterium]|jgi:small-conductance mechanosensitive channel|nr:mechanosensitive ion channel domain-containing protein [Gemmatimonadaceae bacterium]